jgi:acetyl-CoA C-acetyltransferase
MASRSDAYLLDAVRTPRGRGRPDGGLHTLSPVELGAIVLRSLDARTGFAAAGPEDVVFGVGDPVYDQGADLARSAVLLAGMPDTIPGSVVTRFCSSGLDAVNLAAARIAAGQADLMVAGGVEMMSLIPIAATGGPNGSDARFNDVALNTPLGQAADLLATLDGHTRADVDRYAVESQARAARAWSEARFARSIVPVHDANGRLLLDRDQHPRPGTDLASLAKLPPAFEAAGRAGHDAIALQRYPQLEGVRHVHTGGNSSGIVDGAAAVLVGSAEAAARLGLRPRARILSFANAATDPCLMLTAPAEATRRCVARAGIGLDQVDLVECNEAFASVVLHFMSETGIGPERVNVNGGAIALGHPIGATGAILVGTLLDELERRGGRYGVVTLCVGLGMAVATAIERVDGSRA